MTEPLLALRCVSRTYRGGEETFPALRDVTLAIQAGEWVTVIGASGSGKSTLMNVLGCLDRPTAGAYAIAGRNVSELNVDELASLRCTYFGLIFQRYNLLPTLTALANVEVPAVYAGVNRAQRHVRAQALLERFKLADRATYRPDQLSGGEQQRVSIARALINGGEIILADEPTGALDSRSGEKVLATFRELHAEGRTIIIVTHDSKVAAHSERVIELKDGTIVADRRASIYPLISERSRLSRLPLASDFCNTKLLEGLRDAISALRAHRLRSALTMLGIIIGIASVASIVALGNGGREKVLNDIRALGTNTIDIYPGNVFGDEKAMSIRTLKATDATALAEQPYVEAVTPVVSTNASIRFGAVSVSGSVNGVGDQYFRVYPFELLCGSTFTAEETRDMSQVVVVDNNAAKRLFARGEPPLGQVILLGTMPARVIGVVKPFLPSFAGGTANFNVWLPYTSVIGRLTGPTSLRSITVRVRDETSMTRAGDAATALLEHRHGAKDFFFFSTDTIRKSVKSVNATMTLLISSIAVVSLVVGGIGVMNIMLVSVTERTREIGVRMAVGARQRDIRQQFLIEATLVCVIGGTLGVLLSLVIGLIVHYLNAPIPMAFSPISVIAALAVSTLIGIGFGYFPAKQAAALDPVDALARE